MAATQRTFVVEAWSPTLNVKEMAYFAEGAWFAFIGDVVTEVEASESRDKQKGSQDKSEKRVTSSVVLLTDGVSLRKIRRYFRVEILKVFVPHRDNGFTNSMFIQMGSLSEYVGNKIRLAQETKKDVGTEIDALKEEFAASLRSKLDVMVKNDFFTPESFDVSVIIKRGKNLSVFAFINFFDVSDYTMGLASMVLLQKHWEMLLPEKVYLETRFNRERPQQQK